MSTVSTKPGAGRDLLREADQIGFPLHAAVAAMLAGLLFAGGVFSVAGPLAKDNAVQVAAALAGERRWALVAMFGAGLGIMFGIWALSAMRSWLVQTLPDGGEQLGTAAFGSAVLAMGLFLTGMVLTYGGRYHLAGHGHGGSDALLGLVDAAGAAMMLSKFAIAVFVAALSIATTKSGRFPKWFGALGALTTISLVVSSIGLFTEDSFTQFGGPLDLGGTAPAAIWGLILCVLLVRTNVSGRR